MSDEDEVPEMPGETAVSVVKIAHHMVIAYMMGRLHGVYRSGLVTNDLGSRDEIVVGLVNLFNSNILMTHEYATSPSFKQDVIELMVAYLLATSDNQRFEVVDKIQTMCTEMEESILRTNTATMIPKHAAEVKKTKLLLN